MARFCLAAIFVVFTTVLSISPTINLTAANLQEWVVVQIEGTVKIRCQDSEWSPLRRGATVNTGTEIQTGKGAKVLLARGSETITIEPESTLEFLVPSNNSMTRILQKLGGAIFNIRKRDKEHFEVLTPHLVATVKGTEFSVRVDPDGGSINVLSGRVGVSNRDSGKSVDVSAGQFALVNAANGAIATGGAVAGGVSTVTYAIATTTAIVSFAFGIGVILFIGFSRRRVRRAASDTSSGPLANG